LIDPHARFEPDSLKRPSPVDDFGLVDAVLVGVVATVELLVQQRLARMRAAHLQRRDTVDRVDRQRKPIHLVLNGESIGVLMLPLLLVAAHMQVVVIGAAIGQPVNQPRRGVEVEDDRLVSREQRVEFVAHKPARMLGARHQPEEIHDIVLRGKQDEKPYCLTGECSPDFKRCLTALVPVAS